MRAGVRCDCMKGRIHGLWCIIEFFNDSSSPTAQKQMKMYFEAWLTGSIASPNYCCCNGTACHSSLIYSLSLKAWHQLCNWNCFCLSLNYYHQPSQNVYSLCAVWLHANCGRVLGWHLKGWAVDNEQHIIVFARSPLSHPFPVAAPGIRPFHFLSLYMSPCLGEVHLFWPSPSHSFARTNTVSMNLVLDDGRVPEKLHRSWHLAI